MKALGRIMKGGAAGAALRGLALFCLLLGGAAAASAEVPVKFTYQGNLRQNGFLVNGNRNMIFRVYDSSIVATSNLLWTSGSYNVQLSTGVFRITLEPSLTDWQSGSLWLELEVEGVRMSPREELTSAPYSVNSLMVSGKRYTTAASAPVAQAAGDLWMDTVTNSLKFWNGTAWMLTSGSGIPGVHAFTHAPGGSDPIVDLGTHTVYGYITVSSAVNAGWLTGDGSGIYNFDAAHLAYGTVADARLSANVDLLDGDQEITGIKTFVSSVTVLSPLGVITERVRFNDDNVLLRQAAPAQFGGVYASTHVYSAGDIHAAGDLYAARLMGELPDGSVLKEKLHQSGCSTGQILQWNGSAWICASGAALGVEEDPLAILKGDILQPTTFYVSSGTVNNLNVNYSFTDNGTALIRGAPGLEGLRVDAAGNTGIGAAAPAGTRLQVKAEATQTYALAVGVGASNQVVVSTSGAVGIGTDTPNAKLQVKGEDLPGGYIAIFNSGPKVAAWLRNK